MPDWWMLNAEDLHSKDNKEGTTNPTSNNDESEGYSINSQWINIVSKTAFICTDATLGAAVWLDITTLGTVFPSVTITGDTLNIATQKTPASASDTGTKGDIVHDAGYIYVCVATDEWERVAIASW